MFTRRMHRAGEVVGVELIDHLIVAAGGAWVSVKERGSKDRADRAEKQHGADRGRSGCVRSNA